MSNVEPGKAKSAGIVGILILITALVNIICGCIYAGMGAKDGSGLWSSFGQLVIAILGIVTRVKLAKMPFVFFLVMSILWLIICIVQVVVALIAWLIWYIIRKGVEEHCYQGADSCLCSGLDKSVPIPVSKCSNIKVIESCIIAIVITTALSVILIFAASIIGCMGVCCAKSETNVVVVQQPGMVMTQQVSEPPPKY